MMFVRIEEDDLITIKAVIDDNKIAGYINYKFKGRSAWLNSIFVEKEYRCRGLGQTLLEMFEQDCIDHYIKEVEGKYYPHDEEGSVVKKFYEKNGYSIIKDGYNTEIFKFGFNKKETKTR